MVAGSPRKRGSGYFFRLSGIGQPWDLAPAVLLVGEAGGRFVGWRGGRRLDRTGGLFGNDKVDGAVWALAGRAECSGLDPKSDLLPVPQRGGRPP